MKLQLFLSLNLYKTTLHTWTYGVLQSLAVRSTRRKSGQFWDAGRPAFQHFPDPPASGREPQGETSSRLYLLYFTECNDLDELSKVELAYRYHTSPHATRKVSLASFQYTTAWERGQSRWISSFPGHHRPGNEAIIRLTVMIMITSDWQHFLSSPCWNTDVP